MTTVIAWRPKTDRGSEILDELEERHDLYGQRVPDDGTRRYQLDDDPAAGVNALNPKLDKIAGDWRTHLERP
jgi:hypothetical protein